MKRNADVYVLIWLAVARAPPASPRLWQPPLVGTPMGGGPLSKLITSGLQISPVPAVPGVFAALKFNAEPNMLKPLFEACDSEQLVHL